jgi:hydrogenase maturation protein HypF
MNSQFHMNPDGHTLAVEIRVRGRVQSVGFRPTVWRYASELGLSGDVLNDSDGVLIRVVGNDHDVAQLIGRLRSEPPPLARIDQIETRPVTGPHVSGFHIVGTQHGEARTEVAPDAVTCPACAREILDPFERRFRYPFANCTHCGPRFSVIRSIPFARAGTSMAPFVLCEACEAEYRTPTDRRFHAEAIACHSCGPRARLVRFDGSAIRFDSHSMLDDVDAVCGLLHKGHIVALKGLGGYQLACDATQDAAVRRLREAKHREAKPFALMARDMDVIRRYCKPDAMEERLLQSAAGPIVILQATGPDHLPEAVAPGLRTLGFMLPTTPVHLLALRRMNRPVVMTSGNLAGEPQAIDDDEAARRLSRITAYALVHDRTIANRVDDSVARVMGGAARLMRRARGFVPEPVRLPQGFETAPALLAMGGELKATFCLLRDAHAVLSQHHGDLEDDATFAEYRGNLGLFTELFRHAPKALVADLHPEYLSTKLARARAREQNLPLVEVQHHHAHVAACLVENGRPLTAPPVLGIVLDGMGWGADGTIWGGEFLLADYRSAERLGTFKPVAMPGGVQAIREPWRNLYAHLVAEMSWAELEMNFAELDLYRHLEAKPRAMLDSMIRNAVNSPRASSCGRLFDAVAAALGICRDRQAYEGEAACRLESIVDEHTLREESDALAYPFAIPGLRGAGLPYIEPLAMWRALLGDLILSTPAPVMAARFHKGLARAIVAMTNQLARRNSTDGPRFDTVALSGGCMQNQVLFEELLRRLQAEGFTVLSHAQVPANDGGLALGQAAVAAARLIPGTAR